MVKISLIGAGNRAANYHARVLSEFQKSGEIQYSGVFSRNPDKANALATSLQTTGYNNIDTLLAKENPDAICLVIPPRAKDKLIFKFLDLKLPIFTDTPLAESVKTSKAIFERAQANSCLLEIAEDEPYWPEVELQNQIAQSGVLGRIISVSNQERSYYYHAIARLQKLQNFNPELRFSKGKITQIEQGHKRDQASLVFKNGLIYSHQTTSPKSDWVKNLDRYWEINCEKGIICADGVKLKDEFVSFQTNTQNRYSVSITLFNQTFKKEYPFSNPDWSAKHYGLYTLYQGFLNALKNDSQPYFGIEQAHQNVKIWKFMRLSSRFKGIKLPYPLLKGFFS